MEYRGIVCEHCGKFLDFSLGLEGATAVVCLYCKETVPVSYDRIVRLISRMMLTKRSFLGALRMSMRKQVVVMRN